LIILRKILGSKICPDRGLNPSLTVLSQLSLKHEPHWPHCPNLVRHVFILWLKIFFHFCVHFVATQGQRLPKVRRFEPPTLGWAMDQWLAYLTFIWSARVQIPVKEKKGPTPITITVQERIQLTTMTIHPLFLVIHSQLLKIIQNIVKLL